MLGMAYPMNPASQPIFCPPMVQVVTLLQVTSWTPLSSFTGTVESIEVDKNSVSVIVSMFGRETPVEFELDQVEVISQ